MSTSAPVRPPTDPPSVSRGNRRRREIAAVAEQVFLVRGFAATTMQAVAAEAGASKETLYRQFGSKEELFAEVVSNRARRLREGLDADFDRPNALAEVLHDLGVKLLTHMSQPDMLCLMRMVIAEVPRDPKIGRIFFEHGPERTRARLGEYLEAARARGEFRGQDAQLAASIFLSATLGSQHLMRLTLIDPPRSSPEEIEARVAEIVAVFLARYGTPSTAP